MLDEYISRAKALADFEACNAEIPRWTPQRVKTLLLRLPAADVAPVVLPCKVGDTVYFVNAKQILEFTVVGYAVDETGISWVYSEHVDKTGNTNERTFSPDRFGKNTFLTREEAERAMEGKKDG